jgi:hypothetical protein
MQDEFVRPLHLAPFLTFLMIMEEMSLCKHSVEQTVFTLAQRKPSARTLANVPVTCDATFACIVIALQHARCTARLTDRFVSYSVSKTSASSSAAPFFSIGGLNPQYLQVSGYPVQGLPGTGWPPWGVHMFTGCGFCFALGFTPTSIVAYKPSAIVLPIRLIFMTGSSPPCLPMLNRASWALVVCTCLLVL